MASVTSNIVTPQQAAINRRMNPFSGLTSRLGNVKNAVTSGFEKVGQGVTNFRTAVQNGPKTLSSSTVSVPPPVSNPSLGGIQHGSSEYDALVARNKAKNTGLLTQHVKTAPPVSSTVPPLALTAPTKPIPPLSGFALTDPNRVINAQTGQTAGQATIGQPALYTPPPQPTPTPPAPQTYPGLITSAVNSAQANAPIGQRAADISASYGKQIADVGLQGGRAQAGYRTTGTSPVAEGNAAIIAQTAAAQQEALAKGQSAALQGTGQQLTAQSQQTTGLLGAGGLAQPTQVPYSNQFIDPQTGQPMTGGASGSLQDAVSGVVQRLQAGTMSYNDALSALSGYGQGGVNALQQALPPNFNIAQSNTLAGQQGSVGVNYQLAETALTNVESILKELGNLQTTNIPAVNNIANWISTQFGIGSTETRAMTGAVQSLRNAYASLLASVKGGTPTDYSSQAAAEIPNEPTPNDIAAVRKNFETLGQARKNILGNPGQAGGTEQSGGTVIQTTAGPVNTNW